MIESRILELEVQNFIDTKILSKNENRKFMYFSNESNMSG